MRISEDTHSLIICIFIAGLILCGFCVMYGLFGYHLEWSWINGRWIWVDYNGRVN